MTSCQTFYCTNEKRKCEKKFFFFVIIDQDYPCQHIDHAKHNTGKYDSIGDDKKERKTCA